jgi:hypothetical protein
LEEHRLHGEVDGHGGDVHLCLGAGLGVVLEAGVFGLARGEVGGGDPVAVGIGVVGSGWRWGCGEVECGEIFREVGLV